ncbi:hypothetical protein M3Y97_00330500 [Aphelenchoides bicaudatus]|nr:hypothetical protein M3Y97_00330500 [Aphelenchoides bicaudatus]
MTKSQTNSIFNFLVFSLFGHTVLCAPWQEQDAGNPTGCSGRNFMGFGCGGNGNSNSNYPTFHHIGGGNILKNLPSGANTTLIPLGQVLIPTGKEVCCCTNQNRNNNNNNGGNGCMFGNSNNGGYGSSMGNNYGGCCQTSGDDYGNSMYGQYGTNSGQPYGNGFMPNSGYMNGGGQGSNFGFGGNQMGQMNSSYQTGDYNSPCGGSTMDGCCPCKARRRRFVDQLFRSLKSKRRQHGKTKNARIY